MSAHARGCVVEERALRKLDVHLIDRRSGSFLVRGVLTALLAAGSLSGGASGVMAKTLTGSADSASATVVVAHSNNGVRMRTAADADVLDIFPDGTSVTLRTGVDGTVVDAEGVRWWPVTVYGENGWIAGDYLDDDPTSAEGAPTSPASSSSSSDASNSAAGAFANGDRVAVKTDDGKGLAMRDAPSTDGKRIAALGDGDVVTVVSGPETDSAGGAWYKINDGDTNAFVSATFLVAASEAPAVASISSSSTGAFGEGDSVAVASDDGTGLTLRDEPATSGKRLGALGDGDVVTVVSGPVTDGAGGAWYKINDGDINAYVSAQFLIAASASTPDVASTSSSAAAVTDEAGLFNSGDFVTAAGSSSGVNLRQKANSSGSILGALSVGDVAQVESGAKHDGDGNAWYKLTIGDLTGYAREDFLTASSATTTTQAAAPSAAQAAPTSQFIYPVAGFTLTQGYGCTDLSLEPWNATLGCYFHNALDLAAPAYTPIMATAAGTVTAAGWCDCGLGFYVSIDHGNGFSSTYGHMAEQPYVVVGQTVNQGDVIGPLGSTGASTGPHTHFMLLLNGETVDPLQYLPAS